MSKCLGPVVGVVLALGGFVSSAYAEESRWALLVGIDDYIDPSISDLTGSVNDVIAIREALVTAAHFPSDQVFLLTSDDPAAAPTRGNIRARMDYIAAHADTDDLVYLHFSLHAVIDEATGEGYLLTHRTDPREYRTDALPVSELKALIESLGASKRMLVVDGCRNDPERGRGDAPNTLDERFSRGLTIVPRQAPSATAFTQVLFACKPGQRAYEWPGKDRGLFSVALEEALLGEADGRDGDGDGQVTLGEVVAFVRERVPDLAQRYLPDSEQVPDVDDPPRASAGFVLADVQLGGRRVSIADLPRSKARPLELAELEAFTAREAETMPTLRIVSAPEEPLTREAARRVTLRFEAVVDRGVNGYRYRLDDGEDVDTARAFVDLPALGPGTHAFQVQVQDWWGNWSAPAKCEFSVLENRRPQVTFGTPLPAELVRGKQLEVQLAGSDEDGRVVGFRLALDDPDRFVENAEGRFTFEDVVDGAHTLFAQSLDDEGATSLWTSLDVDYAYFDPDAAARSAPLDGPWSWTKGRAVPEIEGFTLVGDNAQGYPEYDALLADGVAMRFVLVPAGSFLMGSPDDDPGRDSDERPQHRVTLDAFLLAKTECTQRQWRAVMGSNPSAFADAGPDAPVEQVSWDDVQAFERKTGLDLPSEAQWEYACRAGPAAAPDTGAPTPRGAEVGGLDSVAWSLDNSGVTHAAGFDASAWGGSSSAGTHVVASKAPNAFGLHDMLGNVWEWCEDDAHPGYVGGPSDGAAWVDPLRASERIRRGGGWMTPARDCRPTYRGSYERSLRYGFLGFRAAHGLR